MFSAAPAVMARRLLAVALMLAATPGCSESSRDGTAILRNNTDQAPLEVVVRNEEGELIGEGTFDEVYVFDTEFPDREVQCLVDRDGGFEVLGPLGKVLAEHRFADRPVCERDEIIIEPDGSLVWK